uniref:Cathepsin propeptide inhibitor domain-containing protein n=1 Tax=Cuerna arida TaxID=1464854 RepID=A0A1B6FW15_9HEMI
MKFLLLAAIVAVALSHAFAVSEDDLIQWQNFKVKYNKVYATPEEELKRRDIFLKNLKYVREHNEKYKRGEVSFEVGINEFSDMTNDEFNATHTGLLPLLKNKNKKKTTTTTHKSVVKAR